MLIPTLIVVAVTAVLLYAVQQRMGLGMAATREGLTTFISVMPLLAAALVAAACLGHLVPPEWIAKWIGKESGAKGIFIGSAAGMIMPPGGPIVVYAIAASLLKAGAGFATLVAFVTAYNLLAIHRLPFEVTVLGWKFLLLRVASVILLAPLAGFLAHLIAQAYKNYVR